MHLKVCPNPECGKVSDVNAAMCETCGQTFPAITLVSPDTEVAEAPTGTQEQGNNSPPTEKQPPRTAAWPLIMMAIMAGGIPLLWANRAQLPTPKTWQVGTSGAESTGGTSATSSPIPPSAAPISPPPAAVDPAPSPPAPVHPPAQGAADIDRPTPKPAATDSNATSQQPKTAKAAAQKKIAKPPRPKKTESARPCTEATAALGLCDPK